jgi:CDP-2,3-bis-(O-geranylgeranyl)-sn-glycerol synthase
MHILLESFWFMLPAYFAAMAPVFARKIDFLNIPVDFGRKFKGKRIFGPNKTWKGVFFGVLAAVMIAVFQSPVKDAEFRLIEADPLLLGLLIGLGAMAGDLAKSFFKRQIGIPAGKPWIPFDQMDYALGAIAFASVIYMPSIPHILTMVLLSSILHFVARLGGFHLGIRKNKI